MPSETDVMYLYQVLTHGGAPTINWGPISGVLNLNPGATAKRWSRLKKAMDEGKDPGPSAYELLWLCAKHSERKAPDWAAIANLCNTTAGAAAKRYSRMKQAFERGDAAPRTPAARGGKAPVSTGGTSRSTKRKRTVTEEGSPTPRRSAQKTAVKVKREKHNSEPSIDGVDNEDEEEDAATPVPKKAKTTNKKKRTPTAKSKVKVEDSSDNGEHDDAVPPTTNTAANSTSASTLLALPTKSDHAANSPGHSESPSPTCYQSANEDSVPAHPHSTSESRENAFGDGEGEGDHESQNHGRVEEWLDDI